MLPLPYAPSIDVDAERLRNVDREAARPAVDVGAGLAQGIATGMTMKTALEADNKKQAAEIFQKEYLDKGNEGIAKMVAEAGDAAKGFPIQAYQIPAGTPPDKARDMVLLAAKDLTGYKEKAKDEKNQQAFQDTLKNPNATPQDKSAAAAAAGAKAGELLTYDATVAKAGDEAKKLERRAEFLKALPAFEQRAMKAARSAEEKASLQTAIASEWGDVKEAQDWVNAIPVKETAGLDAMAASRADNLQLRKEVAQEGRLLRYSLDPQNEKTRSVASSLIAVDNALKNMGVAGGIWDKDAAEAVPGRGTKWAQNLTNDPKMIDFISAYRSLTNEERNRLFGATLTGNEKTAFDQMVGNKEIQNPQFLITALQKMTRGVSDAMYYPGPEEDYDKLGERGILTVENVPGFGTNIKPRGYLAKRVKATTPTNTPTTGGKKVGRFEVVVEP